MGERGEKPGSAMDLGRGRCGGDRSGVEMELEGVAVDGE
jgi:hypothetical protein